MDEPMPALRLPTGVATVTPLPTEVVKPLANEPAAALPNVAAPVSVFTLPELAPLPVVNVDAAVAGRLVPTRAVNETVIHSLLIVPSPSVRLPPRRLPWRVVLPCEGGHHSAATSSSVPTGARCEPRHGSAAGSHRIRCKDGSCPSPPAPAKCRGWCGA